MCKTFVLVVQNLYKCYCEYTYVLFFIFYLFLYHNYLHSCIDIKYYFFFLNILTHVQGTYIKYKRHLYKFYKTYIGMSIVNIFT